MLRSNLCKRRGLQEELLHYQEGILSLLSVLYVQDLQEGLVVNRKIVLQIADRCLYFPVLLQLLKNCFSIPVQIRRSLKKRSDRVLLCKLLNSAKFVPCLFPDRVRNILLLFLFLSDMLNQELNLIFLVLRVLRYNVLHRLHILQLHSLERLL